MTMHPYTLAALLIAVCLMVVALCGCVQNRTLRVWSYDAATGEFYATAKFQLDTGKGKVFAYGD